MKKQANSKTVKQEVVSDEDGPYGVWLTDRDIDAMTTSQLREAVRAHCDCGYGVVRLPDGSFDMAYGGNYDFCDADVRRHADGSFDIVEIYEDEEAA